MTAIVVNGKKLTPAEKRRYLRKRRALHGGIAAMYDAGHGPGVKTDTRFVGNRETLDQQFSGQPEVLKQYVANARRHGYEPKPNDQYIGGLAAFPGDPKAFVPANGDRSHIRKVCEANDLSCQGDVKVKRRSLDKPPEATPLGEDIVQRKIKAEIKKNPDAAQHQGELRQKILRKHAQKTT